MTDLFAHKAEEWDKRPVPAQISEGVFQAIQENVSLSPSMTVMDFGAGTGLICSKLAPLVKQVYAVDISAAMLEKLCEKIELKEKVETFCQNILETPLSQKVDLVVSAMAMHHVEDTQKLLHTLSSHMHAGGTIAIADLDKEDGDFHPADVEGVYHDGFERETLVPFFEEAGFTDVSFVTACEVQKEEKAYPIFLVTARKAP